MFTEYFVTCNVAVALRQAGFNELCMGIWCVLTKDNVPVQKLYLYYNNIPPNQRILIRPEITEDVIEADTYWLDQRLNTFMPPWIYSAPIYPQVLKWLSKRGLYIHPCRIPILKEKSAPTEIWTVAIYSKAGSQLWPQIPLMSYQERIKEYYYDTEQAAYEQAILAALKILEPN
jgi:hypothetical protein